MSENKLKNKVISGLAWIFGERILAQLIALLVTIVLARLLTPEHYGIISIVMVFITLLDVFVTSGFGGALVRKKNADKLDYDTAFVLSCTVSIVLYAALFFSAPLIANFYEIPILTPLLRVMGLKLPFASITNIQRAFIQKEMAFKKFFVVTLCGTGISGAIGIVMAYMGFGAWALVAQHLSNVIVSAIFLSFICKWHPRLKYSINRAREIWSFGWKVLTTQLIVALQSDLRSLIIGKVFGAEDLAYYDQGHKYPSLLTASISSSIDSVMLSAYSREQDNRERILSMLRRSVKIGVYVLAPVLFGFAAASENFVVLLLTDKWLAAVPYIQIFCLAYITRPLESSCRQALLAISKSGSVLIVITTINCFTLAGILVAVFVFKSVFAVALISLLTTLVSLIGFMSYSRYYFNYKLLMQIRDTLPSLLISIIMGVSVTFVGRFLGTNLISFILQIIAGVVIYVGCSLIFKLEPFYYLLNMIKRKKS